MSWPHPNFRNYEYHPKAWGCEKWIVNDDYCGKILEFKKGSKFSMHFHYEKSETFFIEKGFIKFSWIDTEFAKENSKTLLAGTVIDIPRFLPHQIEALEDTVVIEFSTRHYETDSYRVKPGDSQKTVMSEMIQNER